MKPSKLHTLLNKTNPWQINTTPIWPTSTFILQRNLNDKCFPEKLEESELNIIKNTLKETLLNSRVLKNPTFYDMDELSQRDREFLYEHFCTLQELKHFRSGQGFCIDESKTVVITVNFTDHLCIHVNDPSSKWEEAYRKLQAINQELSSFLNFAYNTQFGFLTADPSYCGTGFIIESLLHLPLLLNEKKPIEIMTHMDHGIMFSSITRNLEFTGDIGIIQNNYTLGISEDQIIHLLHTNALKLMTLEQELQQKMTEKPSIPIKDRISRAYGTLINSYQIDTKEAMSAISMLKLGLQLKWIDGINLEEIHKLFFDIQRAHLLQTLSKEPSNQHIAEVRADFLKTRLQNLSLHLK